MQKIEKKRTPLCIGIDPRLAWLPASIMTTSVKKYGKTFEAAGHALAQFSKSVIDAVSPIVPAIKIQIAFYEQYGEHGIRAFSETVAYGKEKDLIVIADAKRGDIASTSEAYAQGFLGKVELFGKKRICFDVDALTVNPFLGEDSLDPFIQTALAYKKGIFILVKTSNPRSGDIQNAKKGRWSVSEMLARRIEKYTREKEKPYGNIGAVVGATYPHEAQKLRRLMPHALFLVPGYGVQGARVDTLKYFFNDYPFGALISASRSVVFSYCIDRSEKNYSASIVDQTKKAKKEIEQYCSIKT